MKNKAIITVERNKRNKIILQLKKIKMEGLKFYKFCLALTCAINLSVFVSSQVNTDITFLMEEIVSKREAHQHNNTKNWLKPDIMTEYGKFMLCVDAYQKIIGIRLMDNHYFTNNDTTALPEFKIDTLKVKISYNNMSHSIQKRVMHCPLHTVKFSSLYNNYGEEFYISGSADVLCVYIYTPIREISEETLNLQIKAKVCELMLNIRYNRLELDKELIDVIMQSGLDPVKWSNVEGLDNEMKFIMCLDIHEKLTRTQYYSHSYTTSNINNELPSFNFDFKALSLINGINESIIQDFEVLHCPLHAIQFPNRQPMDQFYLAKSIHDDCVYKMVPINRKDFVNVQRATTLYIRAEICGIIGYENDNVQFLENDLVKRLQVSKDPSFDFFSWDDMISIKQTVRFHMCINVMKKVHLQYFFIDQKDSIRTSRLIPDSNFYKIKLNHHGMNNVPILAFKCQMHRFSLHPLADKPFILVNSPIIGCVYRLTNLHDGDHLVLIKNLICGIYPPRYFLQLNTKLVIHPFF